MILDGLLLIYRFLEIVCYIKPKFWIMENVPEVRAFLPRVMCKTMTTLNAANFGVPQIRNRTFFGSFPTPRVTHSKSAGQRTLISTTFRKWRTVKETLDFEKKRRFLQPSSKRFGDVMLSLDKPSNTITCISRYFIEQNEETCLLDVNDLSRLMGFSDEFVFTGSDSDRRRQIGNAVCPPVAKAIAEAILR